MTYAHISYRILNSEDVKQFHRVFSVLLQTEFPGYVPEITTYLLEKMYTPAAFSYWIRNHEKQVVIASSHDTIAGFAVLDYPYGGVSFCRWLGVIKSAQKQGIGTALITLWQKMAIEQHAHKMEVAGQPTAKGFYEKAGLALEGYRRSSYFGIDQYLFGKILGTPDISAMTK